MATDNASHPDEIDRMLGNDNGDTYLAWVQRQLHVKEAYAHLTAGLGELRASNTGLDQAVVNLMAEARWIERGYSMRNAASGECDCPGDRDAIPACEGRCTGCGARLYPEARRHRIEVAA